jgi:L-iditol 2-dehydrogenase
MKAVVKYAPGDGNVELRDVEEPVCRDDQARIEIAFCGVCGTDIHVLRDTFRNYPPVILGHELAGTVVEVGRLAPSRAANAPTAGPGTSSSARSGVAWGTASTAPSRDTSSPDLTSCTPFPMA